MPYTRRYRTRRYRKRRTLSNYNVATRTSARSQAKQIYALNRKVNYIQRMTKPEIKLFRTENINYTTTSASTPSYIACFRPFANNWTIDGSFCRLHDMTLYATIQTKPVAQGQTFIDAAPISVRFVMVQTRASRGDFINFDDVFYNSTIESNENQMITANQGLTNISAPFADGFARIGKVYYDRTYKVNNDNPLKVVKMKYKRLLNYYKPDDEPVAKGDINVFTIIYCPTMTPTTAIPSYSVNLSSKIAYTDS
nr:MAG: putative capsid protein [Canine stool-associated circular virus]